MTEELILSHLIYDDKYLRKVFPFLKPEYFHDKHNKILFNEIAKFFTEHNTKPSKTILAHEIYKKTNLSQDDFEALGELIESLDAEQVDQDWLVDTTEEFCKDRAIYNAIQKSILIIDEEDETHTRDAIPNILKEALSVSFDSHIGHDFFEDAERRYDYYTTDHPRIPFDIDILNKITNGGVPRKTLNAFLSGVNAGKSLALVHLSAAYMTLGYNVLYITLEMAEEEIMNRIDANLTQIKVNHVADLNKTEYLAKIQKIKKNTTGNVIVKEYPTSSAHVGHIRTLLQELKMKKNFVPDIIMVDYIGIMASARVKLNNTNSYGYLKAVAEELRGLAVEQDVIVWTAVQVNREGFGNSDFDMTNTADAWSIPGALDFYLGLIRTEELDNMGQILVKQLKSRYGDKNWYNKFCLGLDTARMYLYDIDENRQPESFKQDKEKESKKDKFSKFKV